VSYLSSAVHDFLSAVGSAKVDALHDLAFRPLLQFSIHS